MALLIKIVITILIILLLYLWMIKPAKKGKKIKGLFAHRGYYKQYQSIPENSLMAFEEAIKHGYGIELDVQISANDELYVYHDKNLFRFTQQDMIFSNASNEIIDNINIFGQHVPKLKDVLSLIDGQVPLIVEVKPTVRYKTAAKKVKEVLENYKGEVVVESFDPRILLWFRIHASSLTRGQLLLPYKAYNFPLAPKLLTYLLTNCLARPHFISIRKDKYPYNLSIRLFHTMGGNIIGWTIQKDDPIREIYDGIIFEHFVPDENLFPRK